MKKFSLTKDQFDHLFFPNVVNVAADDDTEFETSLRLVRLLRDPNKTVVRDLTAAQRIAIDEGGKAYPSYELRRDEDSFILETDVHRLALKRLKVNMKRVGPLQGEEYDEMYQIVKEAKEWKPPETKKKKETAAAKKKRLAAEAEA